jgi:hypothetical protein
MEETGQSIQRAWRSLDKVYRGLEEAWTKHTESLEKLGQILVNIKQSL